MKPHTPDYSAFTPEDWQRHIDATRKLRDRTEEMAKQWQGKAVFLEHELEELITKKAECIARLAREEAEFRDKIRRVEKAADARAPQARNEGT